MAQKKVNKDVNFCKPKKGLHRGSIRSNLTKTEYKVFTLISEGISRSRIMNIMNYSYRQALQKHLTNLKNKGYLDNNYSVIIDVNQKVGGCTKPVNQNFRLHNEHYVIELKGIIPKSYNKLIGKRIEIDKNHVVYNKSNIEIYSNTSFFGSSPSECTSKSLKYWYIFIRKIERYANLRLIKQRRENITLVNGHLAEIGNELAKQYLSENRKLKVIGNDGKQWLIIDNSFNFKEFETVHPKEFKTDMDKVQNHFNDIRYNDVPLISELANELDETKDLLNTLAKLQLQTQEQLAITNKQLRLLIEKDLIKKPELKEVKLDKASYIG